MNALAIVRPKNLNALAPPLCHGAEQSAIPPIRLARISYLLNTSAWMTRNPVMAARAWMNGGIGVET